METNESNIWNQGIAIQLSMAKRLFLRRTGELWDKHADELKHELLRNQHAMKLSVGFRATMQWEAGEASIETALGFSTRTTDKTVDRIANPNQMTLTLANDQDPDVSEPEQPNIEAATQEMMAPSSRRQKADCT